MNAIEISRTGLDVEWQRLQVIAQNLANENTTRTTGGGPYRPVRLLSGPRSDFSVILDAVGDHQLGGVQVLGVEQQAGQVRKVHDPQHPHADVDGFVSYPDIDHAGEMALLVKTSRAYEANLAAMSMAQQMYARALELGK